jgi:cysteine dioxygenase
MTPEERLAQINYAPYCEFDPLTYKRILLERTETYEIILICWKAGQSTPIHDHPARGCTLKVLEGHLLETDVCPETLEPLGARDLVPGSVGFKQGSYPLHILLAIEDSVTLHLYEPPNHKTRVYPINH